MWFLLGLAVGASIRFEPSTGPCSLAEVAQPRPEMPMWANVIIGVIALGFATPIAVLFFTSGGLIPRPFVPSPPWSPADLEIQRRLAEAVKHRDKGKAE